MSNQTSLITQGTQLSLRRVPRKMTTLSASDGVSIFDSEEFAYLVNVNIGSQDFWITFDTGSSDLWVVASSCTDLDCQEVPMYSPSASSTLHLSDVVFDLSYLLGSVQGSVATETVTLGTFQIVSQTLALANGTNGMDLRDTGNSGILGLSFTSAASVPSRLGTTVLDNVFSHLDESYRFFAFKLGRNSSINNPNATISSFTIGKLDPSITPPNASAQLTYLPVFKTQSSPYDYWKLPIRNVTINGLALPMSRSLVPGAPSPIGVFDSGTTLILGPVADVETFWNMVGTGESARYNIEKSVWEVRCDRAVDVRIMFGQDGDSGGNGNEYPVHPEDISWAEGGQADGWCMGGVQGNDEVNSGDWLLGDVFLRVKDRTLALSPTELLYPQNVYVVHQGQTSSQPPVIGLLSLTDPQIALTDFQTVRGSDPAPPPLAVARYNTEQWTKVEVSVSIVGGFLLGGLVTAWCKVGRRSKSGRHQRIG